MIMPGELRRQDQITWIHYALLAVHRRVSSVAFDHEAERGRGMAVRSRVFSGLHILKGDLQGVCRKTVPAVEPGIDQPNNTALAILKADHLARADETLVHIAPFPEARLDRSHGLRRQALHPEAPIAREIFFRHLAVQ